MRPSLLPPVLSVLILAGCAEDENPLHAVERGEAVVTGQGVLVVAVDGLRWDHTTLAGYDRDTTPFLARFAETGAVFTEVWAPTPALLGAHVALLSGCDPVLAVPPPADESAPAAFDTWVIPPALQLVARPFLGRGWETAAFVDHPGIAELRGFGVGFREFIAYGGRERNRRSTDDTFGVAGVGGRFLRWINERPLDEDWFAYVHMHDLERQWSEGSHKDLVQATAHSVAGWKPRPELDFVPPLALSAHALDALPAARTRNGRPRTVAHYELEYDRALRALDVALERFFGHIDEFGRADDVTIVLVGSYGQELGEHGLYLDAALAEEEDLRVPLLIRPSRAVAEAIGFERGTRVDALVSSIDLAPTLVELFDLAPPTHGHGVSLVPYLSGETPWAPRQRAFAHAASGGGRAVVGRGWGFVESAPLDREAPRRGRLRVDPGTGSEILSSDRLPTLASALLRRWESLLLEERRRLHFGLVETDTQLAVELSSLQLAPLQSLVEPERTHARPGPDRERPASDG